MGLDESGAYFLMKTVVFGFCSFQQSYASSLQSLKTSLSSILGSGTIQNLKHMIAIPHLSLTCFGIVLYFHQVFLYFYAKCMPNHFLLVTDYLGDKLVCQLASQAASQPHFQNPWFWAGPNLQKRTFRSMIFILYLIKPFVCFGMVLYFY